MGLCVRQVGISSVWYEGNPCNMHLIDLALDVKRGVEEAGMVGYRFNTIGVSDGISMGTDGMSFSLQSRDLIADSVETVMGAQWYVRLSHIGTSWRPLFGRSGMFSYLVADNVRQSWVRSGMFPNIIARSRATVMAA